MSGFKFILGLWVVFAGIIGSANAQFHQKSQDGSKQMHNPFSGGGAQSSQYQQRGIKNESVKGTDLRIIGFSPKTVEYARAAQASVGIKDIPLEEATVWGRVENHPDGTYTETIVDDSMVDNNERIVIQRTRRQVMTWENMADTHSYSQGLMGEDPIILERHISLDAMGRPDEVMIYDGQMNYKYHGKFIYDQRTGRLLEQQIRDHKGKPLRKIIQEYDAQGKPKPLKHADYAEEGEIPKDLTLMATRMDALTQEKLVELEMKAREAEKKGGFIFGKKKKKQAEDRNSSQPTSTAYPAGQLPPVEPEPKKRRFNFRGFKRN